MVSVQLLRFEVKSLKNKKKKKKTQKEKQHFHLYYSGQISDWIKPCLSTGGEGVLSWWGLCECLMAASQHQQVTPALPGMKTAFLLGLHPQVLPVGGAFAKPSILCIAALCLPFMDLWVIFRNTNIQTGDRRKYFLCEWDSTGLFGIN